MHQDQIELERSDLLKKGDSLKNSAERNIHKEVLSLLPKEYMKRNPWRLGFFFFHTLFGLGAILSVLLIPMVWPFKLLLGFVIGHCWAMNGFVAHELMHGSIVKTRWMQDVLGFFMFTPFLISPTFWRFWHNKLHHGHTQRLGKDPDAFPNYRLFRQSRFSKTFFSFTPGSGSVLSYLYFFFWFTFNTQVTQFYFRFKNRMYDRVNHKKVWAEIAVQVVVHALALNLIGIENFLWLAVIPFFVQNYLIFSYISTNHNLSPLTKENNPFENSLTVTNHPFWEYLHLNFGYHVEHHLLPTVNPKHNKKIHKILKENYKDSYQYMHKWRAIKELYRTPRIYKDSKTLIHPKTGKTTPTI